jgi:hypothetical protein
MNQIFDLFESNRSYCDTVELLGHPRMLKTKLPEPECGNRSRKWAVAERSSGMVTFGPSERGGDNQQPSAKLWPVQIKRAVHRLSGGGVIWKLESWDYASRKTQ